MALAYGSQVGVEYFPTKVADLMAFYGKGEHPTKVFERIHMSPAPAAPPEMWLLGSSDQSAQLAAHFGLAFSYAHFISPDGGPEIVEAYRRLFQPSQYYAAPEVNACLFVICAETQAEADRLMLSRDLSSLRREKGEFAPFPSVQEALAYPYTDQDRAIIERARQRRRSIYGDPDHCRAAILEFAGTYEIDEAMILTITHDPAARRRSYELLAEAFNLKSAGDGAVVRA
jgi:luciferase family oxidoreductase group 1